MGTPQDRSLAGWADIIQASGDQTRPTAMPARRPPEPEEQPTTMDFWARSLTHAALARQVDMIRTAPRRLSPDQRIAVLTEVSRRLLRVPLHVARD